MLVVLGLLFCVQPSVEGGVASEGVQFSTRLVFHVPDGKVGGPRHAVIAVG